jgi:hypothetical protein
MTNSIMPASQAINIKAISSCPVSIYLKPGTFDLNWIPDANRVCLQQGQINFELIGRGVARSMQRHARITIGILAVYCHHRKLPRLHRCGATRTTCATAQKEWQRPLPAADTLKQSILNLNVITTWILNILIIGPKVFGDARGFTPESFNKATGPYSCAYPRQHDRRIAWNDRPVGIERPLSQQSIVSVSPRLSAKDPQGACFNSTSLRGL